MASEHLSEWTDRPRTGEVGKMSVAVHDAFSELKHGGNHDDDFDIDCKVVLIHIDLITVPFNF